MNIIFLVSKSVKTSLPPFNNLNYYYMKSKQEMNRLLYNVAVHCKTEEEANEVLKLADILL